MNWKQKALGWLALIVFFVTLIAVPIRDGYSSHNLPAWAIESGQTVRFDILALEWFGIAVTYGAMFFLLRSPKSIAKPALPSSLTPQPAVTLSTPIADTPQSGVAPSTSWYGLVTPFYWLFAEP
ncbi:MAG: hypothetical protein FJ388_01500 [Verrucomicrobia bacterium]|nr:hypothetical protein [Verrucomicrobiota bacterium]